MKRFPKNWPTMADDVWFVPTEDGCSLGVHVYGNPLSGRPVVILLHGALSNSRSFDVCGYGLAPFLKRQGYTVYALDFRGRGFSSKPQHIKGWDIDDLIHFDLPALLAEVKARTGAERVDAVGHSLGGIVLLGYLATGGKGIQRVVSLGGTVTPDISPGLLAMVRFLRNFSIIPIAELGDRMGFIANWIPLPMWSWCCNPKNVPPRIFKRFLTCGSGNIAMRKINHLKRIAETGRLVSADGTVDYSQMLRHVTTPIRLFGGTKDTMIGRRHIQQTHDLLTNAAAEIIWCGRERGFQEDYGHLDLVLGARVEEEIFAEILSFLQTSHSRRHQRKVPLAVGYKRQNRDIRWSVPPTKTLQ